MAMWSLKRNGKTVFSMPKTTVLRSFMLNHLIHHWAQLTVYLRLLDIPVPLDLRPERRTSILTIEVLMNVQSPTIVQPRLSRSQN